MQIRDII
jgi:hypothetical protein